MRQDVDFIRGVSRVSEQRDFEPVVLDVNTGCNQRNLRAYREQRLAPLNPYVRVRQLAAAARSPLRAGSRSPRSPDLGIAPAIPPQPRVRVRLAVGTAAGADGAEDAEDAEDASLSHNPNTEGGEKLIFPKKKNKRKY